MLLILLLQSRLTLPRFFPVKQLHKTENRPDQTRTEQNRTVQNRAEHFLSIFALYTYFNLLIT